MIGKQTTLDLNGPILSFITQPQSVSVCDGGSATFVGIATAFFPTQDPPNPASNTGTLSYRWNAEGFGPLTDGTFQGASIVGSGTTTLTITNAKSPAANGLRLFVGVDYVPSAYSQPVGSAVTVGTGRSTGNAVNEILNSNSATLTVFPVLSVAQQPISQTAAQTRTAIFTTLGALTDTTQGNISYRWQLNGNDLSDSSNISGSGTPNLLISLPNIGTNTVRARLSHPTSCNSPIFTNTVNFNVFLARAIINIEDFAFNSFFRSTDLSIGPHTAFGNENPGSVYVVYAPERNIRVRITLASGAGESRGGFLGGQGGVSIFNYTFEQNVEYVFKMGSGGVTGGNRGGANNIFGGGVAQLYRKAKLVAACGGGGAAGTTSTSRKSTTKTSGVTGGRGGDGGGVNLAGQPGSGRGAGNGGISVPAGTFLNGAFSSGTTGGIVSSCMRGDDLARITGIPVCDDYPGLTQIRSANGAVVSNSAFLFRGFKPSSPQGFRTNGGNGSGYQGGGGSGAYGGNAAVSDGSGGGGGSGYSDGSISLISSTVGGNTSVVSSIRIELAE
jgi:hypothetical protein